MISKTEEEKMWEGFAISQRKLKIAGWKQEAIKTLKSPVDIVVIKDNRIESQSVWRDVTDYERAVRLIVREQKGCDNKVVAVEARKFWLGDLLKDNDIII
jgi:hypothetical protein